MKVILCTVVAASFLFVSAPLSHAGMEEGKALFNDKSQGKCAVCHNITDKKKVGPGLAGVMQHHTDDWVRAYLADAQKVWEENNAETQAMKERIKKEKAKKSSKKIPALTGAQIDSLIAYLKTL